MPIEISDNGKLIASPQFNNLRSEAVSEIISNQPGFLIRYGISIFLIVLILIGVACWFIQYPNIVSANAKLTSINAPKAVITKISGKLILLKVKEGDRVNAGTIMGCMESIGNPQQVLQLLIDLDSIDYFLQHDAAGALSNYTQNKYIALGELQPAYQTFMQSFLTYRSYATGGFFVRKKQMLLTDENNLQQLNSKLQEQKTLTQHDLELEQKTMDANDYLLKEKVISPAEYRIEKSKLINSNRQYRKQMQGLYRMKLYKLKNKKRFFSLIMILIYFLIVLLFTNHNTNKIKPLRQ
jgi:HlyD family secretion protein